MTYTTLMVNCELGQSNTLVLNVANALAERFQMRVIGIAVSQPTQIIYGDYYLATASVEEDIKHVETSVAATEHEFRTALASRADQLEWRSATVFAATSEYIAKQMRSADLVITGLPENGASSGPRQSNIGDLVLQAGRPVLIVPGVPCSSEFEHIVIGWKESREARRAICDALPLLKKAAQVSVVEIAAESNLVEARNRLDDVARWLDGHGVDAHTLAVQSNGHDAKLLDATTQAQGADLVVAGAYGHSRLREWAFGGFTTELMQPVQRCSFVSH